MSPQKISQIAGCGSYLPERCVLNADLPASLNTSDEWILARTGIRQRYIAAEGELTSDLAAQAGRRAMAAADAAGQDIDLVLVATSTPDQTLPSTAAHVQRKLGLQQGAAFDLQAVCSGFVYALSVADCMIRAGQIRTALVIGAETFSRVVDWNDRTTCVLFGDGAGAVVLRGTSLATADAGTGRRGILRCNLFADGRYADILETSGGVSMNGRAGTLRMAGKEVFRHATLKMAECVEALLTEEGLTAADIDWMIPHQANSRIIQAVGQRLGVAEDKTVITVAEHANTSAASIPLALTSAVTDGRIQPGKLLALQALGAGLTWGACLIRW